MTKQESESESYTLILKPKIDPMFSCPQSVLHLETVINGIKKGEIEVIITKQND